jgi:hypothetical protein
MSGAKAPSELRRSFAARIAEGDSYVTLLVCIVFTYVVMAIVEDSREGRPVISAAFGITLLLAMHTSHVRGRWMRAIAVVVVLSVGGSIALAAGGEPVRGLSYFMVALIIAAPIVVLVRVGRHPVVNLETVIGAVDAYLLIGIAFAAVYALLNAAEPPFFSQGPASGVEYLYFSFTVLTTLGFGDLTPGQDMGRVVVTFEALLGQIFLVTVVAVLVSNLGRARARVTTRHRGDPDPDELPENEPDD